MTGDNVVPHKNLQLSHTTGSGWWYTLQAGLEFILTSEKLRTISSGVQGLETARQLLSESLQTLEAVFQPPPCPPWSTTAWK